MNFKIKVAEHNILRAVSVNSRDGACFKLDGNMAAKKQWHTED